MCEKLKNLLFIQTLVALLFASAAATSMAQSAADSQVAKATTSSKTPATSMEPAPVFNDYRGVKIGMVAKEVRSDLDRYLKAKGDKQDFLVVSDNETAQIFYDSAGKVTAISIDYTARNGKVPTAMEVLGVDIEAKPDGSMYALKRYPAAGYWVSYNRTSGDSPIVTITMQAL